MGKSYANASPIGTFDDALEILAKVAQSDDYKSKLVPKKEAVIHGSRKEARAARKANK